MYNYVKQLNLKIYGYKNAFMTTAFSQSSLNWYFIHNTQIKHFCGILWLQMSECYQNDKSQWYGQIVKIVLNRIYKVDENISE